MNPTVENIVSKVTEGPRAWGQYAVDGGRTAATMAANVMTGAKKPARRLIKTGLKLNTVAHDSVADLLKLQARALEGTMDAGARRMELLADADSLRAMVKDQIALVPESRDRVVDDARKALDILNEAREELIEVINAESDTVIDGLEDIAKPVRKKATAAKKRAKKAATSTKKKVTKKATRTTKAAKKAVKDVAEAAAS